MNNSVLKILGLVCVVGSAVFSVGGSLISKEQRDREIEKLVTEKLAEAAEKES